MGLPETLAQISIKAPFVIFLVPLIAAVPISDRKTGGSRSCAIDLRLGLCDPWPTDLSDQLLQSLSRQVAGWFGLPPGCLSVDTNWEVVGRALGHCFFHSRCAVAWEFERDFG